MTVFSRDIKISSKGNHDIIDITDKVQAIADGSKIKNGLVTVFVSGSTASVTTIEYEPGLIKDIPEAMDRIAPRGRAYHHDSTWGDGNGYSHVSAAVVGPSFSVPLIKGKMALGTWQQIVVVDHDNRSRNRNIIVQVIGE
ncbi:MAG: secondary thiamine-phosphate synthase enzyme YjbQ [bacterium]